MKDSTPPGSGHHDQTNTDAALGYQNGIRSPGYSAHPLTGGRPLSPSPAKELDPMLAGAQAAIANLTAQVNRAYEDLLQRGEQLKQREAALREREQRVQQTLADAQQEAATIAEGARRSQQETLARTEAEAARIVERAHGIEGQTAQRLAEAARREQELREREESLNLNAQRQQAERDWINEYAQRLTSIATDLERALGDMGGGHAAGA